MKIKFIHWLGIVLGMLNVPKWLYAPVQEFEFNGATGRIITPNNDGANDIVLFKFSNPLDSGVTLNIYDVMGALVANRTAAAGANQVTWDGKDGSGSSAPGGIYIYQIDSEGKVFNGAIVVAR